MAGALFVVGLGAASAAAQEPEDEPPGNSPGDASTAPEAPDADGGVAIGEDGGASADEDAPIEDGGVADEEAVADAVFQVDDDGWIDVTGEEWQELPPVDEGGTYEEDFTQTIIGRREDRQRVVGSAHTIDAEQLDRYEYDDVHRVVKQVPGVYVREEDGFGLRPNIGLRGASSDRSAKITLLEDGVLLGPAPYAAPAAYYFPLMTRMVGVEVFKGPASIKHGPNTVGGAINLKTRPIPWGLKGGIDVAGGAYMTGKAHGWVGWGTEYFGLLLEGARIQADGFKRLDGGGPTGFSRDDLMLKLRVNNAMDSLFYNAVELKLGFQDEDSHETYLGISEEDFRHQPYRRYASSQLGRMQWRRFQIQARYKMNFGEWLDADVVAYRHDFHRAWTKLNRFRGGPELADVLLNPDQGQNAVFYDVLRGNLDTETDNQELMIGTNDRTFVSQGVQAVGHWNLRVWQFENEVEVGARVHQDQIDRFHYEDAYRMQRRQLVLAGRDTEVTVRNQGSALALATWLQDEFRWRGLLVAPGTRVEIIRTAFVDKESGAEQDAIRYAVLPGVGASYQLFPWVGAFLGLHRGFSPVAPGQPAEVQPEDSWNAEGGVRVHTEDTRAEIIGYFNRYSNLNGTCTFSSGCNDQQVGAQFNGGEVWVYGVEAVLGQDIALPLGIRFRGDLVYTLTLSSFQSDFASENPQWGRVRKGDALPYVPVHQGAALVSLTGGTFDLGASATFLSAMRDRPGQGAILPGTGTDPALVVDARASYNFSEASQIYFNADNVFGAAYIASRRPFGARPGKPTSFMVGYKHSFGD